MIYKIDLQKGLNSLFQKKDTENDTKQSSLFRVRTGLKCGDWKNTCQNGCEDYCHDQGYAYAAFYCDCANP